MSNTEGTNNRSNNKSNAQTKFTLYPPDNKINKNKNKEDSVEDEQNKNLNNVNNHNDIETALITLDDIVNIKNNNIEQKNENNNINRNYTNEELESLKQSLLIAIGQNVKEYLNISISEF